MVSSKLHIGEIIRNGENSLSKKKHNLLYIFLALLIVFFGLRINKEYTGVIVSSLSIFAGFYFTLIVYVTDKTVNKISSRDNVNALTNDYKRFIKDYKDFSKSLISQISYSIILSLILIIVCFLTQIMICSDDCIILKFSIIKGFEYQYHEFLIQNIYQIIITSLFLFILFKLIFMILLIISNMQAFFYEELNSTEKILQ